MILGLSLYKTLGAKKGPRCLSGFANGKMLLVGSAYCISLFANANPLSKQIEFFRSTKILEQSKMLMECTCGTSMDFYANTLHLPYVTFRAWQGKIECNGTYFSGVLKVSCCNLGDRQCCGEFKYLLFSSFLQEVTWSILYFSCVTFMH